MANGTDWIKIRNDYINGHISYRKLAEKHEISFNTLKDRAVAEKWFEKKKEQHNKIEIKTQQKTAEKIAEQTSDLAVDINNAASELLKKLAIAIEQTDLFIEKTKTKVPTKVKDKEGKVYDAYKESEEITLAKKNGINVSSVKQLASALKDLQAIQLGGTGENTQDDTTVNIVFEAATADDIEIDEEE